MWSTIGGDGSSVFADGAIADSKFNMPSGVAVDADGNVYVGDLVNYRVRMFTATTSVWSTIGGDGTTAHTDGAVSGSQFNMPFGVAVGADGKIYVADYGNHRIRKGYTNTPNVAVEVTFDMYAGSLPEAQSKEPAIKTAIAGAGGVSEGTVTVAVAPASRRLLATSIFKARERVATLLGPSA